MCIPSRNTLFKCLKNLFLIGQNKIRVKQSSGFKWKKHGIQKEDWQHGPREIEIIKNQNLKIYIKIIQIHHLINYGKHK